MLHRAAGRFLHAAVAQDANSVGRRPFRQGRRTCVVDADDKRSTGAQARDEVVEHRVVGLDAAEEVEVVGLDVGHHGDVGQVLEQ